jgi:hypothetical protein
MHTYGRETATKVLGQGWNWLECNVISVRRIADYLFQNLAAAAADVDAVGIGSQQKREKEPEVLVIESVSAPFGPNLLQDGPRRPLKPRALD